VSDTTILRHTLRAVPIGPLDQAAPGSLVGRTVAVLNGDPVFRSSVETAARALGAVVVPTPTVAGGHGRVPDLVVDGGVPPGSAADADWRAPMRASFELLQAVAPTWSRVTDTRATAYVAVTWMGGSMCPEHAGSAPLGGLWSGVAKTLPREFPAVRTQVLDLVGSAGCGELVFRGLLGSSWIELGHRDGLFTTLLPEPEEVSGPPIDIGPADTVLVTGGGRGIGQLLAAELARRTGARVVVTGRDRLPDPEPDWLTCGEAAFGQSRATAFRTRPDGVTLAQLRSRFASRARARELRANLRAVRASGARLDYEPCEVTDAASVAELVERLGPGLRIVVHNAGIDTPARLAQKTWDQFEAVVAVKVDGFANVLAAVAGCPLAAICAVGSLTGRYGGMVGQVDYSAANEALARLAADATHVLGVPVKTLAWPTWDGVGLITNLAAAARYMEPIDLEAGVEAWLAELHRAGAGEIAFMGEFAHVSPQHLVGVPVPSDWRRRSELLARRWFLGDLRTYSPTSLAVSDHLLELDRVPFLGSVLLDGRAALPVSLVLEHVLRAGEVLVTRAGGVVRPVAMCDVVVDVAALSLPESGGVSFHRRAQLHTGQSGEYVDVRIDRTDPRPAPDRGGRAPAPLVRARLQLDPEGASTPNTAPVGAAGAVAVVTAHGPGRSPNDRYRWVDGSLARGVASRLDSGRWRTAVGGIAATDLFGDRDPPATLLPLVGLEALFTDLPGGVDADTLVLDQVSPTGSEAGRADALVLCPSPNAPVAVRGGRWERSNP